MDNQNSDQKNLILAVVVSVIILFGWHFLYEAPRIEQARQEAAQRAAEQEAALERAAGPSEGAQTAPGASDIPTPPGMAPAASLPAGGALDRDQALAQSARVPILTDRLNGSLSLTGGRIDDLILTDYYNTVDRETPVTLLSPAGTRDPFYAEFGWTAGSPDVPVPGRDTLWQGSTDPLTPDAPMIKRWDNGQGLTFEREVAIDENFMFTVTQRVVNSGDTAVTLFPYGLVSRHNQPQTLNFFILHEGPIGVLDGTLHEHGYDDLAEEGAIEYRSTGGWLGITDKYWLISVLPEQDEAVTARFIHSTPQGQPRWQADWLGDGMVVAPGQAIAHTSRLFAGAKEVDLLDGYEQEFGIPSFDKAVDFGMFYFMTKPFFYALDFLGSTTGNFGIAIILFTIGLRILVFPLANKSYKSFARMKDLQPRIKDIQERYSEDKQKMQQAIMELYQKEKVNPVAGCVPILIQIPIFFALYKVLFVTIEMRHAPFFGWIEDLSAPDPTSLFNLFGLLPYDVPGFLMIGVWPCLMGLTMFAQQKLNPAPPDPIQAKIMMFFPLVFTVLLASFPAGLVIYWTASNGLSILQQWIITKRMKAADAKN